MTHAVRSHGSRGSEQPDCRPAFGPDTGRGPDRDVAEFYDLHAGALYSLALLLCGDNAVAERIVAATLIHADGRAPRIEPGEMRTALAADVYGRYVETLRERGPRTFTAPASPTLPLSWERRTLLGLVLFGDHSYKQAATLLGVSAESAAIQLTAGLAAMRNTFGSS